MRASFGGKRKRVVGGGTQRRGPFESRIKGLGRAEKGKDVGKRAMKRGLPGERKGRGDGQFDEKTSHINLLGVQKEGGGRFMASCTRRERWGEGEVEGIRADGKET